MINHTSFSGYNKGYKDGYRQGREHKYQEITSEYMLLTEKQVAEIRADEIEELQTKLTEQWLLENLASADDTKTIRRIIVERIEQLKEQTTETWHGYHNDLEMPKGTFNQIFNDCEENNDV